jgi:hypothetical protein
MHVDQQGALKVHPQVQDTGVQNAIYWQTEQLKKALLNRRGTVVNNRIDMNNISYLEKKVFK